MLEVRDLDVAYGAAPALWGTSLRLAAGELVCVLGPNGAGKTTLINAIAGLHPARGGHIVMEGRDPRCRRIASAARHRDRAQAGVSSPA